jgi:hypothetical protein
MAEVQKLTKVEDRYYYTVTLYYEAGTGPGGELEGKILDHTFADTMEEANKKLDEMILAGLKLFSDGVRFKKEVSRYEITNWQSEWM